MIEKSDANVKWLIFLLLVSVVLILITGSLVWDLFLGKDFMEENPGDLGRIGYIPIDSTLTHPQNITIKRVDWYKYLEKPDDYDIDLLIVGDSFSSAGSLPEYLASQKNIQVLAVRTREIQPVRTYSPINLLIALDNGGIIDKIHPDCILLESVPRLLYQQTKAVDFSSNITPDELKRAISLFSKTENNTSLNTSIHKPIEGDLKDKLQKPVNIATEIQAVLADLVSQKAQKWQDPIQMNFDNMTQRMINIRQMMVSLIWLQIYGHTYPIPGQPATVYHFQLDTPLFSSERYADSLFIISGDLTYQNYRYGRGWIYQYNLYLNTLEDRLAKKNITFYFMPAIDKFDFYYPRITNNPYPVNPFYTTLEAQYKAYYYINPKQILEKRLRNDQKDIFWLGDTHWSWMSVEYLSSEISPLRSLEPKPFSLNKTIESLPPDPEIRNSVAEALSTVGEYGNASQMKSKIFEMENGFPLSALLW